MKLELKHLAPYLPYGIQCHIQGENKDNNPILFEIQALNYEGADCHEIHGVYILETLFEDIFPILRPLSDLTKEIEHNTKTLVPIVELFKLSVRNDIEDYKTVMRARCSEFFACGVRVLDSEGDFSVLSFSTMNGFATQECGKVDEIKDRKVVLTMNQHELWQKLYKWHFDVFGLIESGLAIDINTL